MLNPKKKSRGKKCLKSLRSRNNRQVQKNMCRRSQKSRSKRINMQPWPNNKRWDMHHCDYIEFKFDATGIPARDSGIHQGVFEVL